MQITVLLAFLAAAQSDSNSAAAVAELEAEVERRAAIGLEADLIYDDNILRLDDGEPIPLGRRGREDVRLTTSVVVDLATRLSLQRFYLRGRAGYDVHARNSFLDRERIGLEGGVDWRIGTACDGTLSANYARRQSDIEEIDTVARNTRETQVYTANGGCEIGYDLRPELLFRERISDNSAISLQRRDLRATSYAFGLAYTPSQLGSLSLSAYQDEFRFPNREIAELGVNESVKVTGVSVRATRRFARVRANVRLGYASADPRDPSARDYEGATWLGSLVWTPVPRLRVAATTFREVDASSDIAAGYFIRDSSEIAGNVRVGRAVDLSLRAGFDRRRFRDVDPLEPARRVDESLLLSAGAFYRPVDPVRLGFELIHRERDSDRLLGDFESNRAILSVAVGL